MNKTLWGIAACMAIPFAGTAEPRSTAQTITRTGTQPPTSGSADHFTGQVRVEPLFPANDAIRASGAYVTFQPGAHSTWHTHPAGQRLVVTSGVGLVQEWGKPMQEIHPGDVVVCPPGVKHWHGAAPTSAMTHLAITGAVDGKSVDWMEKVSDAPYNAHETP
jgi:quercetin dioxygenase-like cupin family protein